jgi:hypothetical protein
MSDLSARNPVHDMYEEKEFETLQYDVTDTGVQTILIMTCPLLCMPLVPGVIGTKRLVLENEEAVLETKCTLCDTHRRRPYGEMGFVDSIRCLCCTGFMSGGYLHDDISPSPDCNCFTQLSYSYVACVSTFLQASTTTARWPPAAAAATTSWRRWCTTCGSECGTGATPATFYAS